jgi:hypothetical protein
MFDPAAADRADHRRVVLVQLPATTHSVESATAREPQRPILPDG